MWGHAMCDCCGWTVPYAALAGRRNAGWMNVGWVSERRADWRGGAWISQCLQQPSNPAPWELHQQDTVSVVIPFIPSEPSIPHVENAKARGSS